MFISECRARNHFQMHLEFTMNNQRFPRFLRKTVCFMKEKKDNKGEYIFSYPRVLNSSSHLSYGSNDFIKSGLKMRGLDGFGLQLEEQGEISNPTSQKSK